MLQFNPNATLYLSRTPIVHTTRKVKTKYTHTSNELHPHSFLPLKKSTGVQPALTQQICTVAFYYNSQQTYEKGIERCAICLEFSRYCIGNEGLLAVATGLLDEHSEKNATNQDAKNQALAPSVLSKNINIVDCCFAIARQRKQLSKTCLGPYPFNTTIEWSLTSLLS